MRTECHTSSAAINSGQRFAQAVMEHPKMNEFALRDHFKHLHVGMTEWICRKQNCAGPQDDAKLPEGGKVEFEREAMRDMKFGGHPMRHHERQLMETKTKLLEALERMRGKCTFNIPPDAAWNKANLAREAGVNVNTLLRKDDKGRFVFGEAVAAINQGPISPANADSRKRMRARIAELEEINRRQARKITDLTEMLHRNDRAAI